MKILIAYDGTPGARAVFQDLRRGGLPADCQAHVVTVTTAGRAPSARALLLDEARLLAEAGAAHVRTDFPGWAVTSAVVEGSPAPAIVEAAERERAGLIVVGTRGLNHTEKAVLGSVARSVVTNARISVRVARAPAPGRGDACRVLLGFDASPGAEDALAEVCSRTWPEGTEVRALAARAAPHTGPGKVVGAPSEPSHADVDAALDDATSRLARAGLLASSAVRVGEGRRALLDEAAVWLPDAIFVGGRRLQRLRRFLFGSVAGSVADDAPCSVEVVRPA